MLLLAHLLLMLHLSAASSSRAVVVGAGYAGMAAAHHLQQLLGVDCGVSLYEDPSAGSSKASLVSAGLLHPLTPSGKLMWRGAEALSESLSLLDYVQQRNTAGQAGSSVLYNKAIKLVRPFYAQEEMDAWMRASLDPGVASYLEMRLPEHFLQDVLAADRINRELFVDLKGAAELKGSVCVNSKRYLEGLLARLRERSNFEMVNVKVNSSSELAEIAARAPLVIVAAGAGVAQLWEGEPALPVKYARGQNLLIRSSSVLSSSVALLAGEYLVPCGDEGDAAHIFGATYEYGDEQFLSRTPDAAAASTLLAEKYRELLGSTDPQLLNKTDILSCNAAVRVVARRTNIGKIPIVRRHSRLKNVWLLSGLGSRGLLYHSLLAKLVAKAAVSGDESLIPKELM